MIDVFVRTFARRSAMFLISTTVSLVLAQNAMAEDEQDAWKILQKASAAGHLLNYSGIFVYSCPDQTKAVQIKHIYTGHGEYSRTVTLDNAPRELFSQGHDLVIFKPRKEKVVIEKRHAENLFPNVLPIKLDNLKVSYSLHAAETAYVSGRAARLLLLIPKDNLRYSYKFWVDQAYGLLLKYDMLNAKHEVLESIVFNELNFMTAVDLDWYKPQIDTKKKYEMEHTMPIVPDATVYQDWSITKLPRGYVKVDQKRVMAPNHAEPTTQLIFSDGLAAISLFIEPLAKGVAPRIGNNTDGKTSLYADVKSGYQITVVGEVPTEAVTSIGQAVDFQAVDFEE